MVGSENAATRTITDFRITMTVGVLVSRVQTLSPAIGSQLR